MNYKPIIAYNLNRVFVLLIISSLIILTSCNTNNNGSLEKLNNNKTLNHILVLGDSTDIAIAVAEMIEKSDIRSGGYVVIIPTDSEKDNITRVIKNEFSRQQIRAIHVKYLGAKDTNNSDVIALENAKIICLVGDKSYKLRRIIRNNKLIDAIKLAYKSDALIVGIGTASSTICENYFWVDKKTNNVSLETGMALLKNTIIDDNKLLIRNKSKIQKFTTDSSYLFVGMSKDASVYITGSKGIVLNKSSIDVFSSFDNIRTLKESDRFNLLN